MTVKNGNGATPAPTTDWEAEARFWRGKYIDHVVHSTQVLAALSRPILAEQALATAVAREAAKRQAEPVSEAAPVL